MSLKKSSVSEAKQVTITEERPPEEKELRFPDRYPYNLWMIPTSGLLQKDYRVSLKGYKTSEDHRVRIDMGKLADVLADGPTIEQGILYGSEPPPIDTPWK